eukprot:6195709-Pleurochrysis_carterae.AAC.3
MPHPSLSLRPAGSIDTEAAATIDTAKAGGRSNPAAACWLATPLPLPLPLPPMPPTLTMQRPPPHAMLSRAPLSLRCIHLPPLPPLLLREPPSLSPLQAP